MRIMLELKGIDGQLLGVNPNEDHEDLDIKTLERDNLCPRMILKYKPWRWATLSKGDVENYLQNVDMVKVT
jgi:hypothetical protein